MPDPTPIRPWTPSEDAVIRREGGGKTAAQIGLMLGRTTNAVHQRAYRLKVSLQKCGDADYRTKYSDAVVEQARRLHEEGIGPAEISQRLGVPYASIKQFMYYAGRFEASVSLVRNRSARCSSTRPSPASLSRARS